MSEFTPKEARRLAEARTKGPWGNLPGTYWVSTDSQALAEAFIDSEDAAFTAYFGTHADTILDRLEAAEALADSVTSFFESFPKHYHGFPGKLEWHEIHRLKQALSAWRTAKGDGA